MSKLTFIIPTIGRKTLDNTILSLKNQTNPNWNAVIIFDGVKPNNTITDNRLKIIKIEKKGQDINSAGNVRNEGIQNSNTEWVAFVDDDDYLTNNYVETFYNEIEQFPDIDVIIFRMYILNDNIILPPVDTDNFYINQVGISFTVKVGLLNSTIKFIPSDHEDYNLLNLFRENSYKMMISPFIRYYVNYDGNYINNEFTENKRIGNRVFINNKTEGFTTNTTCNGSNIYIIVILCLFLLTIPIFLSKKIKKKYYLALFFKRIIYKHFYKLLFFAVCVLLLFNVFFSKSKKINTENFNNDNNIELVISRYNEDLGWLKDKQFNKYIVTIYNKGNNNDFYKPKNVKIVPLENVGVCNHTYLYHIIRNYDNLAKVTIFLPGSCMDNHKKDKTLETIKKTDETNNSVFLVSYFKNGVSKSLQSFKLDNYELANAKNREMNISDKLKQCSIRPFGKWYEMLFPHINIHHVNYQSIFSVSREHILNRSKESYQDILNYVNTDKNEESSHYIERAFLAIFYPIPDKCIHIYKTLRNNGEYVTE